VALVCAVTALSAVLGGCSGGNKPRPSTLIPVPADGGTVTVGIDQAPTGCNPNTATGDTEANHLVLSLVLPSAYAVDENGQAQYDPAVIDQAELVSTSPQTVVYTINPKAVWSDGTPITATDFIYAWQHQRSVPLGETGGDADVASTAGYDDIATMTPSNRGRSLKVVFSTSYADWESLFADLLPAHVLERVGWSPSCTDVDRSVDLSGGPYEIASANPAAITLVRNPRWWGAPPHLARIVIKIAKDPTQLAHWLFRHTVDVVAPSSFDAAFLQDVTSIPTVKSQMEISNTFLELEFATTGGVTANPLLRAGVAYAVDRQELSNQVVGWADVAIAPSVSHLYSQAQDAYPTTPPPVPANATTTTTSAPSATAPSAISGTNFPTDGDAVREIRELEAAGYLRNAAGNWVDLSGRPLSLRLAYDAADGWATRTADLLAAQLRGQGIAVATPVAAPGAEAAGADLATGKADLAVVPLHAGPFPSATSAWYTPLLDLPGTTGAQDWSGYFSEKVDGLFNQAASQLDPVSAQPLYAEIDQQLWSDMVALPLFAEPSVLVWSASLTGITPGPYGPGLFATILNWARLVPEPSSYVGTPKLPTNG
jgi:peptide/nickel transport system substrate-binding protein